MTTVSLTSFMLFVGMVLLGCTILKKVSVRAGIPTLLMFIILGMIFGADGLFPVPFHDYSVAEELSIFALAFIMFYGGFGLNWQVAKPVAGVSILLSSVGTVATAFLVGGFCYFVLGMPLLEGLLCGALLSSTDAASVFSILRSRNLALKENTDSLLELESGSNDPFAYMLTVMLLAAIASGITPGTIAFTLVEELAFGLAGGFGIGLLARLILRKAPLISSESQTFFVVAIALFAYAAPQAIGGNGFLSVYIAGILLGNCEDLDRTTLVPFFDGLTNIMQAALFFLLGLIAYPSQMDDVLLPALGIALFLTIIARPLATFILMAPFKGSINQRLLVSFAGLRGAASVVFAIIAVIHPATIENDLFHIVMVVVLFSIALQGTLLPFVAKKLKMIDEGGNVLKTFSDYVDETPVGFIQFVISADHDWCGKAVKDIILPPGSILVNLQRGDQHMIPKGSTRLEAGDLLVLCALEEGGAPDLLLAERRVTADGPLAGKTIGQLPHRLNALIILIQREHEYIIPDGSTQILPGDTLLVSYSEEALYAARHLRTASGH